MLESAKSTPAEDLNSAVDRLLAEGAGEGQITEMVVERMRARRITDTKEIVAFLDRIETPPEDEGDTIYEPGELPEGLIDLPSAAKKYGIPGSTLRSWIQLGRLSRLGRLRAPAAGGGYVVVRQADIEHCRDNPRKRGPKPKAHSF